MIRLYKSDWICYHIFRLHEPFLCKTTQILFFFKYLHEMISWFLWKTIFFSQRRINPVYQTIFFKGKQSFPFQYKYFMLAIGMRGRDVHVNVILCYKFCNDITYVVAHNALSYQIGKIFIFKIIIQTLIIIYRDIF